MGVPVVALHGGTWVGRISESILNTIGQPELVARTEDEFIGIAAGLAVNEERRNWFRHNLRALVEQSPFCDASAFSRDLEAAFRAMWRVWCEQRSTSDPV